MRECCEMLLIFYFLLKKMVLLTGVVDKNTWHVASYFEDLGQLLFAFLPVEFLPEFLDFGHLECF